MRYRFIQEQQAAYPVTMLCRVMQVSTSAYYEWCGRGAEVIDSETWRLCQRMKSLFVESRQSLGSRQMSKQLRKEGFEIGRYRARTLMKKLGLEVKRKKRFVLTTDSKHALPVAENLLNREFMPSERTGSGQRISLISGRFRGGSIWPWCWICIHAGSLAGAWTGR